MQKCSDYRRVRHLLAYRDDIVEDNSNDCDLIMIYVLSYGAICIELWCYMVLYSVNKYKSYITHGVWYIPLK